MWVARFSIKYENDIFTDRTEKFNVKYYCYPLSHYSKGSQYLFIIMGILEGEDKNKREFLEDLRKDKRIKNIDSKGDVLTIVISYSLKEINKAEMNTFYDPSIIHIEAVENSNDGREYWTVGSFEKDKLNHLIDVAVKKHGGSLISMNNTTVDNFSLISLTPKISKQQRKVILAAFQHGYYSYPRKIEIKKLASILNMSYSTCQEHLRKAEIALLPNMLRKL